MTLVLERESKETARKMMLNPCEDVSEIQRLVAQALVELQNINEEALYPLLVQLRDCANSMVFKVAKTLAYSPNVYERELGILILGGLYELKPVEGLDYPIYQRVFIEETLMIFLERLQQEENQDNLNEIILGMGHLQDERIVEPLLPFAKHPHEDIRFAVAVAFGGETDDRAIATLIQLSQDVDEDVRDWATFGLGTMLFDDDDLPIDSPEIREALYRNINDPHPDTRYEALTGLADRRDKRILPQLIDLLARDEIHIDSDYGEGFCECLEHYQAEIDDPRLPEILRIYHAKDS
jgi:hypothetical protein